MTILDSIASRDKREKRLSEISTLSIDWPGKGKQVSAHTRNGLHVSGSGGHLDRCLLG